MFNCKIKLTNDIQWKIYIQIANYTNIKSLITKITIY